MVYNWLERVVSRWVPPAGPPDAEAEHRWRVSIFLGMMMLTLLGAVNVMHTIYAHGVFMWADGFATRSELTEIHLAIVRPELRELRKQHCQALVDGNRDAIAYSWEQLEAKAREYHKLTGNRHELPTCSNLGIRANGVRSLQLPPGIRYQL